MAVAQVFHLFVCLMLLISSIQAQSLSDAPSFQLRDIPAECSNPPMGSCTFYADCLESRYHCGQSGYPIGYGQHYCEAFTSARSKFSMQGQEWLTDTMYCLQAALVPEATGQDETTCNALTDKAFGTHATCYVSNGLCSLPASDWGEIVAVVGWTTLLENWDAIQSSLQAVMDCANLGAWILLCTTPNDQIFCPDSEPA
jgi:hypothetical protein